MGYFLISSRMGKFGLLPLKMNSANQVCLGVGWAWVAGICKPCMVRASGTGMGSEPSQGTHLPRNSSLSSWQSKIWSWDLSRRGRGTLIEPTKWSSHWNLQGEEVTRVVVSRNQWWLFPGTLPHLIQSVYKSKESERFQLTRWFKPV